MTEQERLRECRRRIEIEGFSGTKEAPEVIAEILNACMDRLVLTFNTKQRRLYDKQMALRRQLLLAQNEVAMPSHSKNAVLNILSNVERILKDYDESKDIS